MKQRDVPGVPFYLRSSLLWHQLLVDGRPPCVDCAAKHRKAAFVIKLMHQVDCVSVGKAGGHAALVHIVEGGIDVAVLQHDADQRTGVKVVAETANGRNLAQEIGGEGGGNLLRVLEEEFAVATGEAADLVKGHLEGDAGLARVN